MKAETLEFATRTVPTRFQSTGEEYQLTVNINNCGEWTVVGWKKDPGEDTIRETESIVTRTIEILYHSQPFRMHNPKITHANLD